MEDYGVMMAIMSSGNGQQVDFHHAIKYHNNLKLPQNLKVQVRGPLFCCFRENFADIFLYKMHVSKTRDSISFNVQKLISALNKLMRPSQAF